MFCKSFCSVVIGVNACIIQIEADVSEGMPVFNLVGMLGSEVKEAKERVRSAIRNLGLRFPPKRITLNMSPADIRKSGTAFDLSIAFSLMGAFGNVPTSLFDKILFIGELSLDGHINKVNGVLSMVLSAKESGFRFCMVPEENVAEAVLAGGIGIIGADTLARAVEIITDGDLLNYTSKEATWNPCMEYHVTKDYSDVSGQHAVRRAAEIAAAGGHNLLMIGSPGSGKTMIAERMPGILPPMSRDESIEVSRIYSVCGEFGGKNGYMYERPFRSPHHSIPRTGLVGGGNYPLPGEISLAHNGVLFLDELTEFPRNIIELLRQPLENKTIIHARSNMTIRYPCNFVLVAATNPCPCGYYPDRKKCRCTDRQIQKYLSKISHAFLDRIDLVVDVRPVEYNMFDDNNRNESSKDIRKRVGRAYDIQRDRYKDTEYSRNSELDMDGIKKWCHISAEDNEYLEMIFGKLELSARSYYRLIKVSRTIADIEGSDTIERKHLTEAVYYQSLDKKYKAMGGGTI